MAKRQKAQEAVHIPFLLRTIDFVSEETSKTDPGITFKYDATKPAGTMTKEQGPHTGYTARLWKVVSVNGQEQSRNVFNNSTYKPGNTIYAIGSAGLAPDAKARIDAAIATNDEGAVRAAISGAPAPTTTPEPAAPEAAPAEGEAAPQ